MVKVATGTNMDDFGNVITLNKIIWEEYKANYILIAEEHNKTCKHKDANIYLNFQKPNTICLLSTVTPGMLPSIIQNMSHQERVAPKK